MAELLTRDTARAEELNNELSRTVFGSAEQFVKLYSDGWINKRNEEIKSIAQRVTDIYQNVQLKGHEIVFVSQTETMVDDVIDLLRPWRYITKIKRAAEEADNEVFLLSDQPGYLYVKNEDNEYTRLVSERFFRSNEDAIDLYHKFSSHSESLPEGETAYPENTERPTHEDDEFDSELNELNEEENYLQETEETEALEVDKAYRFSKEDLTNIDDTFIVDIYDLLKK